MIAVKPKQTKPRYRAVLALLTTLLLSMLPSVYAQEQELSPVNFKFTKIDNQLLSEVTDYNRQLDRKGLVFHDPVIEAYVRDIGNKVIADQPKLENVEFRFLVLRDPMVNAFAVPDGTIYVTTGLLGVLENEAQLASVLGHEATHVIGRHTYLENRSVRKKALTINILQGVAANVPGGSIYGACIALGASISAAVLNASIFGYSQEKEREADTHGFELMSRASYDPRAMPRTFELLDERLEFEPIEGFYRTHPKLQDRRKAALARLEGQNLKDARLGTEADYLSHVAPAICVNIDADLNSRQVRTAVARASRLAKWNPDEPKYQVLLADSYRALGAKTPEPTEEERGRHGQAEHRKLYFRSTEQEEQRKLLAMPEGGTVRGQNFGQAEKLYVGTVERNPDYADAHRGLGFLYEQEAKPSYAAREYKKYLEMTAGTALDHLRIERRLAQVEKAIVP